MLHHIYCSRLDKNKPGLFLIELRKGIVTYLLHRLTRPLTVLGANIRNLYENTTRVKYISKLSGPRSSFLIEFWWIEKMRRYQFISQHIKFPMKRLDCYGSKMWGPVCISWLPNNKYRRLHWKYKCSEWWGS